MSLPDCQHCPLKGSKQVLCASPFRSQTWAVIGEAPGDTEILEGEYFVGASGRFLDQALYATGDRRRNVHINNVLRCKPPYDMDSKDWRKAIECCLPRLVSELEQARVTHALLCGTRAFHALTPYWTAVGDWLGALVQSDKLDITCIPTRHPAYILRGMGQYRPVFWTHMQRVRELSEGALPYKWPDLLFHGHSPDSIIAALKTIRNNPTDSWIGLDIETAGADPLTVPLTAIGLATNKVGVSLACPIRDNFNSKDADIIEKLVKSILASERLKKTAHNGVHDLLGLEKQGFPVRGYTHDTILLHAVVANRLPHNLGFVAQTEFAIEAWKKLFKVSGDAKGLERFLRARKEELTEYNAKDTAILPDLTDVLLERAEKHTHRGLELYSKLCDTSLISMELRRNGVKVNTAAVERHEKNLKKEIRQAKRKFHRATGSDININSRQDLIKLFFKRLGATPLSYSAKTGAPKLDKDMLSSLLGSPDETLRTLAQALLDYRKYSKLYGTYIRWLIDEDIKIMHATPKVWGTKGGRWSYADPNLQNIPPGLRDVIISKDPDGWILEADYSQLELRIIAYLAGDTRMLDWFNEGRDLHTETARIMFGLGPDDEVPKALRKLAKGVNFGDNYGAEARTIWEILVKSNPKLSLSQATKLLELRHMAHPHVQAWRRKMVALARSRDYVECPLSGRRQYFYGQVEPTKCYNYPIQGTGADIIDAAIPKVHADLQTHDCGRLIFQVHDALICDTTNPVQVARILQEHMTAPVVLNGVERVFPIDFKLGRTWGDGVELDSPEAIAK